MNNDIDRCRPRDQAIISALMRNTVLLPTPITLRDFFDTHSRC
jgi:hypothetical protein